MPGFLAPLLIREINGDDRRWILREPCVYHLKSADGDEWVEAPMGFVTDFGSIPQLLWWVPGLSPFGKLRRAYVVHDWLYVTRMVDTPTGPRLIDRQEGDDILKEAAEVLGANWLNRRIVYRGVRLGGRFSWDRHRRAEQSASA